MLTLKFNTYHPETPLGGKSTTVSCRSFNSFEAPPDECGVKQEPRITIVTYDGQTEQEGVERHISNLSGDYTSCWVTNSTGKTIDHYKAASPEIKGTGAG
jgi:hypothetical protein